MRDPEINRYLRVMSLMVAVIVCGCCLCELDGGEKERCELGKNQSLLL
jgi:hypothetical protein